MQYCPQVVKHPVHVLLMFGKSLKMIKVDRNMLEIRHIVCQKHNFNFNAFVDFTV
jgi:hypothetical protein